MISIDLSWASAAVGTPRVEQHASSNPTRAERLLDDWQIDALRKIVSPRAWELYSELGYPLPGFF